MLRFKNKDTINTLLNIDTVFGEYQGKTFPIIVTLLLEQLLCSHGYSYCKVHPLNFGGCALPMYSGQDVGLLSLLATRRRS